MKIHWHKREAAQLHQVEEYVLRGIGERIRKEFMDEVEQATHALADMPTMGKMDPLFAHRRQTYRSIIVRRLNKQRRTRTFLRRTMSRRGNGSD